MLQIPENALQNEDERVRFEALYRKYEKLMYREARRIAKDATRAENLVQESICALINHAELLFSFDDKQQVVYIEKTVVNMALRRSKQAQREELFPDLSYAEHPNPLEPTLDDIVLQKEKQERVRQLLSTLDADEQYLIVLRYQLQMKAEEIADELSMSPGAVRMTLTRIRRKLREQYEHMGLEEILW